MRHFIEVLLITIAIVSFSFGEYGIAIFSAMFAFIMLVVIPITTKNKSVEQIISESDDSGKDIDIEYEFVNHPGEKFTLHLHFNKSTNVCDEDVKNKVLENLSNSTNTIITYRDIHITSIKTV